MPTNAINQRDASAKFVGSAVDHQGDLVASDVSEFLSSYLGEGETMPDFPLVFLLFQRALVDHREKLIEADQQHQKETSSSQETRQDRDRKTEDLRGKIMQFRSALEGTFGAKRGLKLAGVESRTPEEPQAALLLGKAILERLQDPDPELGQTGFGGFRFEPSTVIAELKPAVDNLDEAINAVTAETRKAQLTAKARTSAIQAHDRVFSWVASALSACFRMAGQDDLARRIRPSLRRPGRTQDIARGEDPAPVAEQSGSTT